MNITREVYLREIKPCFDKIYKYLKNKKVEKFEKVFIINFLEKCLNNEFNMDVLYLVLKSATPKELDVCMKNNIDIKGLLDVLEKCKMDT